MSEAIQSLTKSNGVTLAAPAWSREQVDLIKRTVCPPDTTDDELKLFLHVAAKSGLDPLRKQIHCTKRNGRLTIIAGIDGLQARAAKESDFEGILHGVVCAKDDFAFDAAAGVVTKHTTNPFAERGAVVGAWSTVRRRGLLPFTVVVRFSEFNQGNSPTWKQMPHVMIDKVARSTALRMAYPEQFGGIYEQAEMDQAEKTVAPPPPVQAQRPQLVRDTVIDAEASPFPPDDVPALPLEQPAPPVGLSPTEKAIAMISEAQDLKGLAALTANILALKLDAAQSAEVRKAYGAKQQELKKAVAG